MDMAAIKRRSAKAGASMGERVDAAEGVCKVAAGAAEPEGAVEVAVRDAEDAEEGDEAAEDGEAEEEEVFVVKC